MQRDRSRGTMCYPFGVHSKFARRLGKKTYAYRLQTEFYLLSRVLDSSDAEYNATHAMKKALTEGDENLV